ncbi:hypothetical protein [Pseudoalteromonas sp. OOF1S-7]|uniref:hypothetical protein n=1 Tax=Pseudoalteromonas sp. OOF1S-7 TaxID=2917757 RepID=UPI001EF7195E|nr:hypothetical protein [Pseudoalteromonas sp. OOF1S-7]MCG7535637.1 hypothetical protein [Pseudoalteromonas sp. OOF1S-7]
MRKELTALIGLALLGCSEQAEQANASTATPIQPQDTLHRYRLIASDLLTNIRIQTPAEAIAQQAEDLMHEAGPVLAHFNQAYPQCGAYLDAVLGAAQTLPTLTLQQLELDYHDAQALPTLVDPVCYHPKELLVHPAKVAVMSKAGLSDDEAYLDAELELVELMAHVEQVRLAFKRAEAATESSEVANDSTSI